MSISGDRDSNANSFSGYTKKLDRTSRYRIFVVVPD